MNELSHQRPKLQITTLGAFAITKGNENVGLRLSRTGQILLIYLLTTDQAQDRELLAELFWPKRKHAQAASNLRTLLTELRKLCGEHLSITRASVAIDLTEINYDVACFCHHIAAAHKAIVNNQLAAAVPHWETAIALHQLPFLATVREPENAELQLWITTERELLYKQMIDALQHLVAYYAKHDKTLKALALVQHWIALEPLDEDALQWIMKLYIHQGQVRTALAHYQRFRQLYRQEYGEEAVTPTLEDLVDTRKTEVKQTRLNKIAVSDYPKGLETVSDFILPQQRYIHPTPIVELYGRAEQMAILYERLSSSTTRLVTLVGIGGVGKSLLAQSIGARLATELRAGTCFVNLVDVRPAIDIVTTQRRVVQAIAISLGLPQFAEEQSLTNLMATLRKQELLLILDNCEHVATAMSFVSELLQAAPGLRMIATSRIRLNLSAEVVEPIKCLPLPNENSLETLRLNAAIQLFTERAARVLPGFTLNSNNAPALQRICRAVGGLPLALELAAQWVPLLPPQEIADSLEREISLLATEHVDVAERQRSLTAVLNQTWQLLSIREQHALAALAIFPSSFTRTAALTVGSCGLPTLLTLVNHTLLEFQGGSNYSLHPLIKNFAAAQCTEEANVIERYCTFQFEQLRLAVAEFSHHKEKHTHISELTARQSADVAYAWELGVTHGAVESLEQILPHFCYFWRVVGQPREAVRLLAILEQQLATKARLTEEKQRLLGHLLYHKSIIYNLVLTDFSAAIQAGEQAYQLFTQLALETEVGYTLLEIGRTYVRMEQVRLALPVLQKALEIAIQEQELQLRLGVTVVLAQVYWAQGDWETAATHCQMAASILVGLAEPPIEAFDLWWEHFNQSILRRDMAAAEVTLQQVVAWSKSHILTADQGIQLRSVKLLWAAAKEKWDDAYSLAQEQLAMSLALGNQSDYCDTLCLLAMVTLQSNRLHEAQYFANEALAVAHQHQLCFDLPTVHATLGFISAALRQVSTAEHHFTDLVNYALKRKGEIHALRHLLAAIFGIATLHQAQLPPPIFTEAIALVAAQPQAGVITRTKALHLATTHGIDLKMANERARHHPNWASLEDLVQTLRSYRQD